MRGDLVSDRKGEDTEPSREDGHAKTDCSHAALSQGLPAATRS